MSEIAASAHIWFVLAVIVAAVIAYASERLTIELTSISVVAGLVLYFAIFPVPGPDGANLLDVRHLLAGLADPALITVLALMVVGQGIVQTGALVRPARRLLSLRRHHPVVAAALALTVAAVISGVMNNTPVVVIFIPLMAVLAERTDRSVSAIMMPLSFAAILGGMTTLIGSSTNLLVASASETAGAGTLGFFDFTVPGLVLATVGLGYVVFIAPRLLPDRTSMAAALVGGEGKQFIAQIMVTRDSPLLGEKARAGMFPSLPNITVRMIQRGESPLLPPFDDRALEVGDEIVMAGTRKALGEALASDPHILSSVHTSGSLSPAEEGEDRVDRDLVLAEAVIAPASRMAGRNLSQIAFHHQTRCTALGIQRRSRMIRQAMNGIRLEAGDVLLILGHRSDIQALRGNPDILLLEWSARDVPALDFARRAVLIFGAVVAAAASGLVPIVVAALVGATAMIGAGCLNIFQASRAIDRRVVVLIWAALAMGTALHRTGGALFLAQGLVDLLAGAPPAVILSAFFLLVAALTNVLSNNATAVLFTPIGVGIATRLGIEPMVFVFATIFAANCSFATPMGYQTNLLVMGPGRYRFADYVRAGLPLVLVLWLVFSLFAPWYYDLW